ncbi:MAG: HAMP domain-containing sensor histidine kinase, partial [Pseudomonadota bacterium]
LEAWAAGDDRESLDVSALVSDVAELYEPLAEERGIALKVEPSGRVKVHGNRQLLGQAIANLIDNALKYGAEHPARGNGHSADIVVGTSSSDGFAEISVSDRGPGIPEAERGRVLGRFVRLEESRSKPGSGLGLSLVAAVARLHGGSLSLEDNAPGLRIVLNLPLEDEARTTKTAERPSPGGELRTT